MKDLEFNLTGFLCKKVDYEFKRVYLNSINILEDLLERGNISEEEFTNLRKEILDIGNNSARIVQEQIKNVFQNISTII